jgi:hypothetical protein
MVSQDEVEKQLKQLGFKINGWGRGEVSELPHILMPQEEIYELANGLYEGGFALLVATDSRVLLIDKKPMKFLTVEDLRFDMISEMDYSHRLIGAEVSISSGSKNLRFRSYNQPRLRKLIGHVQHCMAEAKKKEYHHAEGQSQHLESINEQLQAYLEAQMRYQIQMNQFQAAQAAGAPANALPPKPEPVKPSHRLSDYLFAQSLMAQHNARQERPQSVSDPGEEYKPSPKEAQVELDEIYAAGLQEVFKSKSETAGPQISEHDLSQLDPGHPLRIAYAKLPMALRNRKFGRPSFHAHSQAAVPASGEATPAY